MANRKFRIFLIKPSHYDSDGYVIQWRRSTMPSNSLASVYALLAEAAEARALGPDVDIELDACDECNTIVNVKRIARSIKQADGGFVGLIGVQSNQYPRALDLTRQLRAADIPVVIGGFHISGCISMLPEFPADLQAAIDLGATLFAGEGEGRMVELVRDFATGKQKPIYNFLKDLPGLEGATLPLLPGPLIQRVAGHYTSFDAGRGCPYQCSFCTIINVQGRKSRYRTPDEIEQIVRANHAQGITRFFVTDDNFARNKNWEPIFDRLIELREEGIPIKLFLQVDTLCHRIPNFIEKAGRAGCSSVFIGLENINPESLLGIKKRQNKIWEYREMLLAWRKQRVLTYCGYILGFPTDTPETIRRDIEIIKRELPIDIVEFAILTPLPGSEDHKNLYMKGVPMDPDMNKYNFENAVVGHPLMSKEAWEKAYLDAWRQYYSPEHTETIMRRGVATGLQKAKLFDSLTIFLGAPLIDDVHGLQFGFIRRKVRTQRRYGMPIVNPFVFYPWRVYDFVSNGLKWLKLLRRNKAIQRRVFADPTSKTYTDEALTPPAAGTADHLVEAFADKIPKTVHGAPVAPVREMAAVAAE
jgi:radical SAM superfamily enzyme YgiQ (UPF0313 family)